MHAHAFAVAFRDRVLLMFIEINWKLRERGTTGHSRRKSSARDEILRLPLSCTMCTGADPAGSRARKLMDPPLVPYTLEAYNCLGLTNLVNGTLAPSTTPSAEVESRPGCPIHYRGAATELASPPPRRPYAIGYFYFPLFRENEQRLPLYFNTIFTFFTSLQLIQKTLLKIRKTAYLVYFFPQYTMESLLIHVLYVFRGDI